MCPLLHGLKPEEFQLIGECLTCFWGEGCCLKSKLYLLFIAGKGSPKDDQMLHKEQG